MHVAAITKIIDDHRFSVNPGLYFVKKIGVKGAWAAGEETNNHE